MNAEPSNQPADDGTMAGTLRSTFRKLLQGVDGMLPARVLAYDRDRNVATVQPVIAVLTTAGQAVPRAQIAEVPVLALGGGGFVMHFPLRAGDFGWIEASDRDISLFTQSLGDTAPNTLRMHSFEDSRFIPDVLRNFEAGDVADDAMALQSLDGQVRIELSPAGVLSVAPQHTFRGPVHFEDAVTGDATAIFTGDVIADGVSVSTHRHTAQGATAITTPPNS